jgi:hypothetical protein
VTWVRRSGSAHTLNAGAGGVPLGVLGGQANSGTRRTGAVWPEGVAEEFGVDSGLVGPTRRVRGRSVRVRGSSTHGPSSERGREERVPSPPSPPFPTAQSESSPALPPRRPIKTVQGPCPWFPACGLFAARSHCVGCGVWKRAGSGVRGAGARAPQHRARPPAAAGGSVEPCAAFPGGPSEFWPCDPRPSDRSVSRLALLGVVSAERRLGAPPVREPA